MADPLDNPATPIPTSFSALFGLLARIERDLSDIKAALAVGGVTLEAVKGLPDRVTKVEETVATLRLLVFGAVGTMLLGLLGTVGAAVLWVLSHGGG